MALPGVVPDRCPQCGASLPPVDSQRITCAYCGSSLIRQGISTDESPAGAWGMRLKTISCVDQQGVGVEAFRMLIPADWEFEGDVHWLMNNPGSMFMALIRSFRLNPQWYARYMQVSQYLIQNQIQQIRHIGQISQIISRTSDQISDMIMDSYNQRQETLDRLSTQFSQTIRGVDEYYDPFGERGIELPGGYDHAWSNALGEYILTDDPNFNPNIGSNLNWEVMKRQ